MMVFSPDGEKLTVGDGSGDLQQWRIADKTLLWEVTKGVEDRLSSTGLAVSPDGAIIATSTSIGTVKLFKTSDGTLLHELPGDGDVWHLEFSPDGAVLAEAMGNDVLLWKVNDGTLLHKMEGHKEWVRAVVFSPDGSLLASGSEDGTIKFWRADNGNLIFSLNIRIGPIEKSIRDITFSPDGKILVSSSWDWLSNKFRVRLWGVLP